MSCSDHTLSVVRRCRCRRRRRRSRKLFTFSSSSPEPLGQLKKLETKHSWVKGIQVY